jgi:hypothetical protein
MTHSTERLTTATVQDQLLEALADLDRNSPGGIDSMLIGMPWAIDLADDNDLPQLANVWRRFAALAVAVQADMKEAPRG